VPQPVDSTATPAGGAEPAATPVAPEPSAAPATPDSSTAVASGSSSAVAESTAPGKQRTHVVQKNETLSTISLAAYGSPNYYPHILRANPGLDPKKMKVGQSIILPDVGTVKPGAQSSAGTSTGAAAQRAASQQQPAAAQQHVDAAKEYKVVANDSLYRISVKLYGKSDLANKIYELNKDQIGADPAKLKLGTVLKLPSPPTVAQNH
jgi:nucleoid-associated protein YgaU